MPRSAWDPAQYARFGDERSQPFFDLVGLLRTRRPIARVVDLGCGTGALTAALQEHTAAAEVLGVDSSETMRAHSARYAGGGLCFTYADIATFAPDTPFDVVFSNAALHWLPDHPRLLERITRYVLPDGGQLAVQVPANHDHPSHMLAHEVAREEPFASALDGYARSVPVLAPEAYARLLDRLGYREQHVRLQVYVHHLDSREAVVEWVRGTLLTDYQQRLAPDVFQRFLARYRERLLPALDDDRPYLYPFKRILLWGRR